MPRDWDAEWQTLYEAEQATFKEFQEAQSELTTIFTESGAPSEAQRSRAETAYAKWSQAKQKIEAWLDEWRAAQGAGRN